MLFQLDTKTENSHAWCFEILFWNVLAKKVAISRKENVFNSVVCRLNLKGFLAVY